MNRKKIILVFIILGTVGGFLGYKMYNKPHIDVLKSSMEISISANKILDDFSLDETAANKKYLEKVILIKGEISEIKIEREKGIITLKTNDNFGSILCHLSAEATKKMSTLNLGETITIKGICTGFLMDVILVKSEIIN